jgi:hypothetical protein
MPYGRRSTSGAWAIAICRRTGRTGTAWPYSGATRRAHAPVQLTITSPPRFTHRGVVGRHGVAQDRLDRGVAGRRELLELQHPDHDLVGIEVDAGDVGVVLEAQPAAAQPPRLAPVQLLDQVGVEQPVLGRERRAGHAVERVEVRAVSGDLRRVERLHAEPVGAGSARPSPRARRPARLVVHPQVALLIEGDLVLHALEELDRRQRQRDVHLGPPGRAHAAGVELGARVATAEIDVEDGDRGHATRGQVHGGGRAEQAAAEDDHVEALHARIVPGTPAAIRADGHVGGAEVRADHVEPARLACVCAAVAAADFGPIGAPAVTRSVLLFSAR